NQHDRSQNAGTTEVHCHEWTRFRTVFLATDEHGFTRMQNSLKNRQQLLSVNIRGLPFAFYP
ncbi:MAG: hypothetical protein ACK48Y_09065, partial [Planctomyces sp.]